MRCTVYVTASMFRNRHFCERKQALRAAITTLDTERTDRMRCKTAPPLRRHNTQPGSIAAVQARGWACDRSIDRIVRSIDRSMELSLPSTCLTQLARLRCVHPPRVAVVRPLIRYHARWCARH